MTCYAFAAGARMAWTRRGGDWVDARGAPHGDAAFATVTVPATKSVQDVAFDADALVAAWRESGAWPGAVLLRGEQGASGTAEFATREHPDAQRAPVLELTLADGRVERLTPTADTQLGCPNFRSYGAARAMKLQRGRQAVLLFHRPDGWAEVRGARLLLWSLRQTGRGAVVGMYAATLPGRFAATAAPGRAARYPGDIGLEADPAVWLVERFDRAAGDIGWIDRDDLDRVRTQRAGGFAFDGAALAIALRRGVQRAMSSHIALKTIAGAEPDEAYARYYLRFGDDWDPGVDGGKLPGFAGTYGRAGWGGRRSDGNNGWSARGSFARMARAGSALRHWRGIGHYVYHADMDGRYGDTHGWNLGAGGWLEKNRWYCIEQQVKMNTPGLGNGVLRAWVDGRLVFERTDLRFRDDAQLRIEELWVDVYHGGTRKPERDMTLFIDNLVVAREYIGPIAPARPAVR